MSAEDPRHKWIWRKNQPETVSIFPSQSVYNYRSSHATGNSDKIVHIFHLALGWENRQKTGGAHDIRLFSKFLQIEIIFYDE